MTTKSPSSYLTGDWEGERRTVTVNKKNGTLVVTTSKGQSEVVVPEKFAPYLTQAARLIDRFGEREMPVTQTPQESRDAIKLLREMLRQAERGEIILSALTIKNKQKDRWESFGGMERMRLDNTYSVELEMRAYDRRAATQPPRVPTRVDVDEGAMEVLTQPSAEYATLQGDRGGLTSYRVPVQPIKSFAERVLQAVSASDLEYNTLRISYMTRDRLMLDGILDAANLRDQSPMQFMGLDLIVEAPDGRAEPRFEDGLDKSEWSAVGPNGGIMRGGPRTLNQAINGDGEVVTEDRYVTGNGNVTRGVTTTRKKPEPPKRKTPAGASAAREIIFDD